MREGARRGVVAAYAVALLGVLMPLLLSALRPEVRGDLHCIHRETMGDCPRAGAAGVPRLEEGFMPRVLFLGLPCAILFASARGAGVEAEAAANGASIEERLKTDPLMMPYYTGRILPTPQKVEYTDEYLYMTDVAIVVGRDVENPAPLMEILKDRIARYGGAATAMDAPTDKNTAVVSLGDTELSRNAKDVPVVQEKEQAYVLCVSKTGNKPLVILKGHDRLGLLWGISSLAQLVHWRDGKTMARAATVFDYPHAPNRGYVNANTPGMFFSPAFVSWGRSKDEKPPDTEQALRRDRQFVVFCKFNMPVYQQILPLGRGSRKSPEEGYWRTPEKWKPEYRVPTIEIMGKSLAPLGITWYGCVHPHVGDPEDKLCADEGTVKALLHYARRMEAAGGHLDIQLDDVRFPLHPYDKEHFGTARAADTFIVTRVMEELRKECPKARLLVCPPFYWGPVGRVSPEYGEPRDDYLKMIGDKWPLEVDVFWSGQQVNGAPLGTKEYVSWITGLIKRKPFLWQNNAISHFHAYKRHYGTDALTAFRTLYWDGFLEAIGWYGMNSALPNCYIVNAISSDFLWNPKAHDPEKAVREAVAKMVGPDAWDTLGRYNRALSAYDRYDPQSWYAREHFRESKDLLDQDAAQNIGMLETEIGEAQEAIKALKDRHPAAVSTWTAFESFVDVPRGYVQQIKANPKLALYRAAVTQQNQAKEAGEYEPDKDRFLAACNFTGAELKEMVDELTDKARPAHVLSGGISECKAKFDLQSDQVSGPHVLLLNARFGEGPIAVSITMNGRKLPQDGKHQGNAGWRTVRWQLPDGTLREKDNTMVVSDDDKPGKKSAGEFALGYAVLKRGAPSTGR